MPRRPDRRRPRAPSRGRPDAGNEPDPTVDGDGAGHALAISDPTVGGAALLAPFVAWMATQPIDEVTRRRHRLNVEAYLDWCSTDDGPTTGRRRRYENELGHDHSHIERAQARAGLDQFAMYRDLVARTLPFDR